MSLTIMGVHKKHDTTWYSLGCRSTWHRWHKYKAQDIARHSSADNVPQLTPASLNWRYQRGFCVSR